VTNTIAEPWTLHTSIPESPIRPDAAEQLWIVWLKLHDSGALQQGSAVFKELDRFVIGFNPTWQVIVQVSLGEILRSEDADALYLFKLFAVRGSGRC
jgi:hypothetical protein